ncbi:MAG TPA: hypothetical protein VJ984_14200 [Xanthomonadales bacterium]|nr:hypothetical protein [Xanthomonadales bacterium]
MTDRRFILMIAAAILFAPGVVLADFKRDYGQGLAALRKDDWERVASKMQEAIAEEPRSQAEIRLSGMNFVPYVPHFYLGKALFEQGDCIGAAQAWQTATEQGEIQNMTDEFAELEAGLATCQPETVDVSRIAQAASDEVNVLEEANAEFAALSTDPNLSGEWNSDWKPRLDASLNIVGQLRDRLAVAVEAADEGQISDIRAEAMLAANEARLNTESAENRAATLRRLEAERLAALEQDRIQQQQREQDAVQQQQREREARALAHRELQDAIVAAENVLSDQRASQETADVRQALLTAVTAGKSLTVEDSVAALEAQARGIANGRIQLTAALQEWQAQLDEEIRRTPPEQLQQAANAYFAGNYQEVVDMVDPDDLSEPSEKIQGMLFRSAALFNLYTLSGSENTNLLERAKSDIRQIKSIDGGFSPYVAAFSPKFMLLFGDTG